MRRRKSSGFSLIELLGVVAILGAVLAVSTFIIMRANLGARQAARARITVERFDTMIDLLRRDAWAARAITTPDASTARFTVGDDAITWTFANQTATRTESDLPPRQWKEMPAIECKAARGMLGVHVTSAEETVDLLLPSQLLVSGAAK